MPDERKGRARARSASAADSASPQHTDGAPSDADSRPMHVDDSEAQLSEAARGVIRQSADPRLDAHLARMLSETAGAPGRTREQDAEIGRLTAELETALGELRAARGEVGAARADREAAARNARTLTWLLAAAVVAIVILLVVVALR
jgi:hypothetical protein